MTPIDVDFDRLGSNAFAYLRSLYQTASRFPYPLQAGSSGTLLGTSFACFLAHLIGRTDDFPGRASVARELVSLPVDADGWVLNPELEKGRFIRADRHDHGYLRAQETFFVRSALRSLGLRPVVPIPWAKRIADEGGVSAFLGGLDWSNPWLVSNWDMFLGTFLLEWVNEDPKSAAPARGVRSYFDWHDKRMNPETGFWGDHADLLNAMAGGFHVILHYDYAGWNYPGTDKAVRTALGLVWRDGLFVYAGGGGACEDYDGVDILVRLGKKSSVEEGLIKAAVARAVRRILSGGKADGGFPWRLQPSPMALAQSVGSACAVRDWAVSFAYRLKYRSHYRCVHHYSSFSRYPFQIGESDLWSTWFRLLTVALAAKQYPELFVKPCGWALPSWPGLGYLGALVE